MKPLVFTVLTLISLRTLDCLDKKALYSRLNFFDIDLLRYSAEDKHGNVMVSPASIKSTLAMLLEGAEGDTATEIKSALRLSPVKDDLREQLNLYLRALQSNSSGAVLNNANGLFVSKKLKLKKDFEANVRHAYYSEILKLDFSHPAVAVQNINGWVNDKTKGLIPTIVDAAHVTPVTELIAANALYFKSAWEHGFNPRLTRSGCFYNSGVCTNVAMMNLQAELNYAYIENLRSHAVELPYQGKHYSMILLVPQDRDGCAGLIRDLPYMSLPQISDLMKPNDVELTLPKFTVDYTEDMTGALQNMRIKTIFSQSANLSGIFEGSAPYVNSLYHKVHMSVDEAGTVASAATAAMVVPLINSGVQLKVDRPFLFFIRDNHLGLVLFEGKIEEPTVVTEREKEKEKEITYTVKESRKFLRLF